MANEENKSKLEVELVFIGKIADIAELSKVATIVVLQEQYDLSSYDYGKKEVLGKARARSEQTTGSEKQFFVYSKIRQADGVQDESKELAITEELFDFFRHARQGQGWRKLRFVVPIKDQNMLPEILRSPTLAWEIDVFPSDPSLGIDDVHPEGQGIQALDPERVSAWVKVDLEFKAETEEQITALKELKDIPNLPVKFSELFSSVAKDEASKTASKEAFDEWDRLAVEHFHSLGEEVGSTPEDFSLESFAHLSKELIRRI